MIRDSRVNESCGCDTLGDPMNCHALQHSETTYCNTLQHIAIPCNTLQHSTAHYTTLQHTATHCNTLHHSAAHGGTVPHSATQCNSLQHTPTHCNRWMLQTAADLWSSRFRTVVCCSVLQCVAVCCSVLPFTGYNGRIVCCSVLQCVAVCCSVLQCVAV